MQPSSELGAVYSQAMQALQQGDLATATQAFRLCLALAPASVPVLNNLAGALILQRDFTAAREALNQLILANGSLVEPWLNLGMIEEEQNDLACALECYERAIAIQPACAEAYYGRGNCLAKSNLCAEAARSYRLAIRHSPKYADAYHNLGNVLRELRQPELALHAFDTAIKIDARADVYCNRGYALRDLGRFKEAVRSFDQALKLDINAESCAGIRLQTKAQICDWLDWNREREQLARLIQQGGLVAPPHCVLSLFDSGELQRKAAAVWISRKHPPDQHIDPSNAAPRDGSTGKLRIGYFSADLRSHPVAEFLISLIERHDRARFEVLAFAYGPSSEDALRQRLAGLFDAFIDVASMSDAAVAALAREQKIDVAVDLGGFTAFARPGIFAERAAPVQVGYLGYPGTMAASYFDYLMADAVLVPNGSEHLYTEKIARLPHCFAKQIEVQVSPREMTRKRFGMPDDTFVFACFNHTWKFDPETFASWMRILGRVPDSVLFLISEDAAVISNLRSSAKALGVGAERLAFGARVPSKQDYLGRFRLADLYLDTHPYAAATIAVDGLKVGLPIVTMIGETMASRLAASALTSVGLEQLVTSTRQEFEDTAVALALDRERLGRLRDGLLAVADSARLFDCQGHAREVERFYRAMVERSRAGLAPEHLA
jgi:predicted O-linked N-acetylglucosamine transferase (SPINDLY family)